MSASVVSASCTASAAEDYVSDELSDELSPQEVNAAVMQLSPKRSAIVFFMIIFLSEKGMVAKKYPLQRQKALQTDPFLKSLKTVRSIPRDLDLSVMYQQNGRFPDLCIITVYRLPDHSVTLSYTAPQLQ